MTDREESALFLAITEIAAQAATLEQTALQVRRDLSGVQKALDTIRSAQGATIRECQDRLDFQADLQDENAKRDQHLGDRLAAIEPTLRQIDNRSARTVVIVTELNHVGIPDLTEAATENAAAIEATVRTIADVLQRLNILESRDHA